ncbi:MAG TPA: efflux RND transporter periplasmic adaptor subunit [Candidatus Aquabacterium excrementipullorum]|nr:efflux RND transporter periplasmic adaptor subunit [Candidatus Aquabacterium excrementipullorum]
MSLPQSLRRPVGAALLSAPLLLTLAACGPSNGGQQQPPATEVGVVTLHAQPLALNTELPGRTVAARTAEIRPQVSGIIRARLFTEGTVVKAGQALYQIDAASYQAAYDSAQASVAKAQAALASAELTAKRQNELLAADAGTRQDQEDAESTLRQAQATLKAEQAALATAKLDLERTRLASPITGRVDTSTVTAGALVTASQTTALTTVQQLDPILVDIPQSSVDVLKLKRQIASGQLKNGELAIRLVLEDGTAYAHPGTLKVNGVTVNTTTGAVTLRAELPNPEGLLLPGMYVRAVIDQARDPAAILAPQAGITRDASGQATALIVQADGKVTQRSVTVADTVKGQWRVTQGLQDGDRLIVEGSGKVRPGQLVHAVTAASAASATSPSASSASQAASR